MKSEMEIKIKIKLSLWSAIKLRIAGCNVNKKIYPEENVVLEYASDYSKAFNITQPMAVYHIIKDWYNN